MYPAGDQLLSTKMLMSNINIYRPLENLSGGTSMASLKTMSMSNLTLHKQLNLIIWERFHACSWSPDISFFPCGAIQSVSLKHYYVQTRIPDPYRILPSETFFLRGIPGPSVKQFHVQTPILQAIAMHWSHDICTKMYMRIIQDLSSKRFCPIPQSAGFWSIYQARSWVGS